VKNAAFESLEGKQRNNEYQRTKASSSVCFQFCAGTHLGPGAESLIHLEEHRQDLTKVRAHAWFPLPTPLYDVRIFPRHIFWKCWALVLIREGEDDQRRKKQKRPAQSREHVKHQVRKQRNVRLSPWLIFVYSELSGCQETENRYLDDTRCHLLQVAVAPRKSRGADKISPQSVYMRTQRARTSGNTSALTVENTHYISHIMIAKP
jgi:hypothetical protein